MSTSPERRPSIVVNGEDGPLACAIELAQREFETAFRRRLQQQQQSSSQSAVSTPPSSAGSTSVGANPFEETLDEMDLSIIAATTGRDPASLAGDKGRRPISWIVERRAQVEWDFLVAKLVHDVYVKRLR